MSSKVSRLRKPSGEAGSAPARKSGRRAVVEVAKPRPARRPRKRGARVAVRDSERTTAQILEAAIDLIESEGESGVRVHELARKAGRTMGAVYHHFESREGLIEAARALQFRGRSEEDILAIEEAVARCRRPEDLVDAFVGIMRTAIAPERREFRWTRMDVVGSARARPRLAEVLGAEQHRLLERFADVLRGARDRGLLRKDVDVDSLALLAQQATLGFVLVDVDRASEIDAERYAKFFGTVVRSLMPEPKASGRRRGA